MLLATSCHRGGPPRLAPLPIACAAERVGKVTVIGATAADVPQLAVLEGTLDDAARAARIAAISTEMLRARGYAHAHLAVERHEGCGTELVVRVDRGPRYTIDKITFDTDDDDDYPADARVSDIEDVSAVGNGSTGGWCAKRSTAPGGRSASM
jgi:hypothetical protein